MRFNKDSKAQMGTMELVLSVAIGLIVLAAIFSLAPIIGDKVDSAVELQEDAAATGALTFSGVVADAQTINISTDRYEYNTTGTVAAGNIEIYLNATGTPNVTAVYAAMQFAAAVTASDTVGVGASRTDLVVTLTADTEGSAGNSITTTETCTNAAYGATTLTGGTDAGPWADDDIPTGVDIWSDNASLISLVVLVMIISLAIFYIRRMGGGGGGGM